MANVYIQIPGVPGSVTDTTHKNWIAAENFGIAATRKLNNKVGNMANRDQGTPAFGEFEIVKNADQATSGLFKNFCSGGSIPQIQIDVCHSGNGSQPFAQYTLSNVIVSHFQQRKMSNGSIKEYICFNYTKIENRFTPTDAAKINGSPVSISYDLATAQVG